MQTLRQRLVEGSGLPVTEALGLSLSELIIFCKKTHTHTHTHTNMLVKGIMFFSKAKNCNGARDG